MNCDGSLNNFDIDAFVLALTSAAPHTAIRQLLRRLPGLRWHAGRHQRRWDGEQLRHRSVCGAVVVAVCALRSLETEGEFQAVGFQEWAIGEDVAGRAVGDRAAGRQEHHPLAQLPRQVQVVRREQLRATQFSQ